MSSGKKAQGSALQTILFKQEEITKMKNNGISRRSFLKGSAAAAAAMSLASAFRMPAFAEEAMTEEALGDPVETYEADVVIAGAGAAGLMAALELTMAGKKVIVLEKGASAGVSNFSMCGGPTACETKLQAEEGCTVTLEQIYGHMYDFSNTAVNGKLLKKVLSCTGTAVDRMTDLGIPMVVKEDTYGVGFRGRHMFMTGGLERVQPIVDAVEANGGEFIYEAEAREIVMTDGVASGLKALNEDGEVIEVDAGAVLITCGGFLGDEQLQKEHFNTKVFPLGNVLSNGGSIRMILKAGGVLDRNFAVLGNECGAVSAATTGWPFDEYWFNVNEHYGYWLFGGLYVDKSGERFINEKRVADFPLALGGEAIVRAGKAYVIMDADYYNAASAEGGIYAYLGMPEDWASGMEAMYYSTTEAKKETDLELAIEEGWAFKADTIEEIAEHFGLADLPATVEAYNGYCESGVDEEFGKSASFLKAVKNPPFYAFEYVPSAWDTNGGIKTDSHLRPVDADNNAIPGLYAAGVCVGSMYTAPYYDNEGSSVGLAVGSGVLAGKEIEAYLG